jgi:NAD(P)-dependent dehydrogenase (short-subunit alcohol dehydrogenase family)
MNLQLQAKTALVTAGTGGIGFAIVRALASEGAYVAFTGRTQESVSNAMKELDRSLTTNSTGHIQGIVADAGTAEGANIVADQLSDVDVLINNLGIYESKPFLDISDQDWESIFKVNVLSGVRLARFYLPRMLQKNWGRVLFIASEAAITIPSDMIHYAATKTALLSIARGLAETTQASSVTVNSILPGPTRSDGIVNFLKSLSSSSTSSDTEAEAEFFRVHRPTSLLRRLIEADEVANLVAYLASPVSSATNGAALRVEGGLITSIV